MYNRSHLHLLLVVVLGLIFNQAAAGTCSEDFPEIAALSHDTFFSISGESVELEVSNYYYFSAQAGVPFGVFLDADADLDLYVDLAATTLEPTSGSLYESATVETFESIGVIPDLTECYAIAVYGYEAGTYTISVSGETPAPTVFSGGEETDPPAPAPAPSPSSSSICATQVQDEFGFYGAESFITGRFASIAGEVFPEQYVYYFYSAEKTQNITIRAYGDGTNVDNDVDLYVSKYSPDEFPSKDLATYSSENTGDVKEVVTFYTRNAKVCYCIGVTSNYTVSFILEVRSKDIPTDSGSTEEPSKLMFYIYLGAGIPGGVCVAALAVGGICYFKKRSRKSYVNPGISTYT